jgi:hypothetical protein
MKVTEMDVEKKKKKKKKEGKEEAKVEDHSKPLMQ